MSRVFDIVMGVFREPGLIADLRDKQLPDDLQLVMRLAAGEGAASRGAMEATGETAEVLADASVFFLQQILFAPGADSYRVLGADAHTPDERLRENYRWLMKWLHPDRNQDGWEAVYADRVNVAWQDLKTPQRRADYDLRVPSSSSALVPMPTSVTRRIAPPAARDLGGPLLSGSAVRRLPILVLGSLGVLAAATIAIMYWGQAQTARELSASRQDRGVAGPAFDPPAATEPAVVASKVLGLDATGRPMVGDSGSVNPDPAPAAGAGVEQPVVAVNPGLSWDVAGMPEDTAAAPADELLASADDVALPPVNQLDNAGVRLPLDGAGETASVDGEVGLAIGPATPTAVAAELPKPTLSRTIVAAWVAEAFALSPARVLSASSPEPAVAAPETTSPAQPSPAVAPSTDSRVVVTAAGAPGSPEVAGATARERPTTDRDTRGARVADAGGIAGAARSSASKVEPVASAASRAHASTQVPAITATVDPGADATVADTTPRAVPPIPASVDPGPPTPAPAPAQSDAEALVREFAAAYAAGDLARFDRLLSGAGGDSVALGTMRARFVSTEMRYLEIQQLHWQAEAEHGRARARFRDTYVPRGRRKAVTESGEIEWIIRVDAGDARIAKVARSVVGT